MNDTQILTVVLAAVLPTVTVLVGILINNARMTDLNARVSDLRHEMEQGFRGVNQRFDEMKDLWRSELHRVEEVLDARLKHLEDRDA